MKYKCAIFDMDGTLIDSLQGILDAINITFEQLGFNVKRNYDEAKYFIGAGAVEFARRAMKGQSIPLDKEKEITELFLNNYAKTQSVSAKPFPGIVEMVKDLKKHGIKVCIASNKPHILLVPVVKQLFPDFEFDAVCGTKPNKPEKPNPHVVFEIMKMFNLKDDECVYVGDSECDYKTAHNAGINLIVTKYGYGFYDEPWMNKVTQSVESVEELKERLLY